MAYDLGEIRSFFKDDKVAANLGAVIDSVTEDKVICHIDLTSNHCNAAGGIQGGVMFTLADYAFAIGSNLEFLADKSGLTVSQSSSISFLKAPKGNQLIATATCLHKGKSTRVYQVEITDNTGTKVAIVTVNGFTRRF